MESSFTIGKIRGIEIGVHFTWLIVFALVTVSLALGYFPQNFPELSATTDWLLGAAAALLLFGSVLVHELSHSFVAQSKGIPVRSISLFIFGGVSNIQGEPHEARDELLIAAAGPASSLVLGLIFGGLLTVVQGTSQVLTALLSYLAVVNVSLAVFNLIPGFPLDGGRVFRAIVWLTTGSFERATSVATGVGQVIAYIFIFGGLLLAFGGSFLTGIWLAFIGWFLSNAAEAARRQIKVQRAFAGVKVADLMTAEPVSVSPDLSLRDMVDDYVLHRNVRAVPVVDAQGEVLGLVTVTDVKNVDRKDWDTTTVGQVMTPAGEMVSVSPQANASEAVALMGQRDLNQVPVVQSGRLVGLLSQANIMHYLQVRQELGMRA